MRILLVEDEEKVGRFIVRGLKAESHAVDAVADGTMAQDYLASYDYDLAILDVNLPGMNGSDLLQFIRKTNTTLPVLMLTERDSVEDKVRNFERGAPTCASSSSTPSTSATAPPAASSRTTSRWPASPANKNAPRSS